MSSLTEHANRLDAGIVGSLADADSMRDLSRTGAVLASTPGVALAAVVIGGAAATAATGVVAAATDLTGAEGGGIEFGFDARS